MKNMYIYICTLLVKGIKMTYMYILLITLKSSYFFFETEIELLIQDRKCQENSLCFITTNSFSFLSLLPPLRVVYKPKHQDYHPLTLLIPSTTNASFMRTWTSSKGTPSRSSCCSRRGTSLPQLSRESFEPQLSRYQDKPSQCLVFQP